jgi:hypothetical protein
LVVVAAVVVAAVDVAAGVYPVWYEIFFAKSFFTPSTHFVMVSVFFVCSSCC